MRALRAATTESRNSWAQKGQWNGKMFAYVRLCPLNAGKIVERAARGHWGTGKTGRFQISHCEKFDIRLDRRRLRKCSRRCARPLLGIAECESRRLERS